MERIGNVKYLGDRPDRTKQQLNKRIEGDTGRYRFN